MRIALLAALTLMLAGCAHMYGSVDVGRFDPRPVELGR
jgi:hypothetical protein